MYNFTFIMVPGPSFRYKLIDTSTIKTIHITVTGLVQGVGFRPFVYRLATERGLAGWVRNTNENVQIRISGGSSALEQFVVSLKQDAPPASVIDDIVFQEVETAEFQDFSILRSQDVSGDITEISPDIAVCDACLGDIEKPGNRLQYAFVNCTNCGPRFTIIRDLPYDRAKTTMNSFEMCPACRKEYESVTDRRFHAQPTACEQCGPHYELHAGGVIDAGTMDTILGKVSRILAEGGIVLMKGLGGMHLACDAFNEAAVKKLRGVKKRDGKPFAVMFRDVETLRQYAHVDRLEEQALASWRRPIVLLRMRSLSGQEIPENINAGLNLLGAMLPYMPFHYLLFQRFAAPAIVLTSGNFSSEPILTDNLVAIRQFSGIADALLLHNRDIFNRTDDSVVRVIAGKVRLFRRSRGYVPAPLRTTLNTGGILAFGAELTNCFCIGKGHKAFLSQHIGDLQGFETTQFYEETLQKYLRLFRVTPSLLAVDMHPEYISTKTALRFGDLPAVSIQHHHAHVAACMAEHHLDEQVIGVALDGTGYGDDGNSWGSEFFLCDLAGYQRITHFEYLPQPGGDMATEEPWRMAVSWLYKVYGLDFLHLELPFLADIDPAKTELLIRMIDRNINCPLTCGTGRLFDALASLLGVCQVAAFQAEGPMRLESVTLQDCSEAYAFELDQMIRFDATLHEIVKDIRAGTDIAVIATKFHNTIISVIFESVNKIRENSGISKVVLSGGVFQNKYLLEGVTGLLKKNQFEVYAHASVPTNDGGIALGQLIIAAKRRSLKCV